MAAGVSLNRENLSFKRATPIIYQVNLGSPEVHKIPSSELAMHVQADGQEIVAFFITTSSAYVVYANDVGGCGYVTGAIQELLTPDLWIAVKDRIVGQE